MTDSEDWRLQRAAQLGLEPFGHSLVKLKTVLPDERRNQPSQSSADAGRDTATPGEDVSLMRFPPAGGAVAVDMPNRRDAPAQPGIETYRFLAPPKPVAHERSFQRDASKTSIFGPATRASLYFVGMAVAAGIAAAGGAWFATQQSRSPPPAPLMSAELSQTVPATPAKPPLLPVLSQKSRSVPSVFGPVQCAEPKIVEGLRAAATDQMRRSGLGVGRIAPVTVGGVTNARPKIAGTDGSLTICTAVLKLQRSGRRLAAIDVDYAVRTAAGSRPRVVPLAFNHVFDGIVAGETIVNKRAPIKSVVPDLGVPKIVMSAAAKRPPQDTVAPSRIVIVAKPTYVATGPLADAAPTLLGLSTVAALPTRVGESEVRAEAVKIPRGCDQAATLSVAITCRNSSLIALNASVRAAISELDRPRNGALLTRIKTSADKRFDRCTTAPCVERAYRYWLDALARVSRENDPGSVGFREMRTSGLNADSDSGIAQPQK